MGPTSGTVAGVMRPKELTLGALAMALYLWTLAITQAGDPFQLTILVILVFRYLTPVFFWVTATHYFTKITIMLLKYSQTLPLVLDTLIIIEGPSKRVFYMDALAFELYATWAVYAILYPIIIWWAFHRVGLYKRVNRAGLTYFSQA